MAQDALHISLTRLWKYRIDITSTTIPLQHRSHLAACQDCIAVVWLCRISSSMEDAIARIKISTTCPLWNTLWCLDAELDHNLIRQARSLINSANVGHVSTLIRWYEASVPGSVRNRRRESLLRQFVRTRKLMMSMEARLQAQRAATALLLRRKTGRFVSLQET
jgi:hypothetical protein